MYQLQWHQWHGASFFIRLKSDHKSEGLTHLCAFLVLTSTVYCVGVGCTLQYLMSFKTNKGRILAATSSIRTTLCSLYPVTYVGREQHATVRQQGFRLIGTSLILKYMYQVRLLLRYVQQSRH